MTHPAFSKYQAPSTRREIVIAIVATAVALISIAFASRLIIIDNIGGTYGVSIGTNSNYCSIDIVQGHLVAGCEHAK